MSSGLTFKDYRNSLHKVGDNDVNYQATRIDTSGDPSYFGWTAEDGSWVIIEQNDANGTYKYFRGDGVALAQSGDGTLTEGWTNRASHTYVEYNELFT